MAGDERLTRRLDRRINDLLPSIEYRHMVDPEDREAAIELRNRGYGESFPVPDDWEGVADRYDGCSNTKTFGIFHLGKLVSTIRLAVVTAQNPDSLEVTLYGKRLHDMLDRGDVLIDVSRLSVDRKSAEMIPELPYITFRTIALCCRHYNADAFVSSLRTRHLPFYKRVFGGRVVGEPVYYDVLKCEFNLVVFPLAEISDELYRKFTCFESTYLERRQLFGRADAMPGITAEHLAA